MKLDEAKRLAERSDRLMRFATAMTRAAYEFELLAGAVSAASSVVARFDRPEPTDQEWAVLDAEFDAMFAALLDATKPVAVAFGVTP